MKSRKKLICLAVAASLVMGAAFTGCTAVNNEADVKQTVAVVNISKAADFKEEFAGYESAVTDKVFVKRDMLTAYYNGYYQYTQTGSSYAEVFNTIKDDLVSNAVTTQYATVYLLKGLGESALSTYLAKETEADKYEYILNEYDDVAVKRARYSLNASLNSVLDSAERNLLEEEEDDEYKGSGTRSTPSGIDATVEDYVPEFYDVYTGYAGHLLTDEIIAKAVENEYYEPLYGTTRATRQKAYASFLTSLKSNYLLSDADTYTTDIWKLSYVRESYVSQLLSEIVSVFQDEIKKEQEEKISEKDENEVYTYLEKQYDSLLKVQEKDYASASTFESAMGSLSDTKFILYSPSTESDSEQGTFGYVYNILLPFSKAQETQLSVLQSYRDKEIYTESQYFYERNKLLKNIETTDQREAWFNGTTDYSFDVTKYNEDKEDKLGYFAHPKKDGDESHDYLFFENNVTDATNYEALEKYYGRYSYNGTVKKNKNGSYTLIPNKLTIDDMLSEFESYINYVLEADVSRVNYAVDPTPAYYNTDTFTQEGEEKEIDYSKLVYASGKVSFSEGRENMFVKDGDRYKVMAAINELQYAYTTDTGVLSQYIGYTVSAYDTSYIKEFEYAAQQAVKDGAGAFAVCAGDYGWHLIYVTETFDTAGDEVYKNVNFSKTQVETEGTFENRFYNWIKDTHLAKEVTLKNNTVLKKYNTGTSVTVYTDAYKDLGA